jgi:hypothetical protein
VQPIADLEMRDALDSQSSVPTSSEKQSDDAPVDPPRLAAVVPDEPSEDATETAQNPASNN